MEHDLGVLISDDLRWDSQVKAATTKARRAAHSLSRALISRDTRTWTNLYRTFVRPHIEYAASAWIPHQASHFAILGSVQRWYTRQVPGIGNLNHEEREKVCGLESVAARTRRGIAIETFKMTRCGSTDRQEILATPKHEHLTRGKEAGNFIHIKPKKDVRKYSFAGAAPVIWDDVGSEARNATSVNAFKNSYDRQFRSTTEPKPRNSLF